MDPNRLEKASKQLNLNNTANNIMNMEQSNELRPPQQNHQLNAPLHYYPVVHQHHQTFNRQHQSPLLFSISPGNQMGYNNAHPHFQHFSQQAVQNESIYSTHNHPPREPTTVNQVNNQVPEIQPAQILELQRHQINEVQQDVQKDAQQHKTSSSKPTENEKIQLRSPAAKRSENAPVTMQGWLYKQGSEGLMFWKKRWFVLSEFCLFYYKSSIEDKVLGSILLPSYKVSVCEPEDKVNRKHAFKCEHVNMRTYILAADSHEIMMRWINALNLACNLQTTTVQPDQPKSMNSLNVQHQANVPAGQTMVFNKGSSSVSTRNVIHTHTPSNTTEFSNSSQQELSQYNQPLYANAPPKPRRLVDGFCSPTPEILERGYSPHQTQSVTPRHTKSPSFVYDRPIQMPQVMKPDRLIIYKDHTQGLIAQNVDRRTPDTYGRSKTVKSSRHTSDYEDIYNRQEMYKRPLSPGEIEMRLMNNYPTTANHRMIPNVNLRPREFIPYDGRSSRTTIPRPHSADFLEHRVQDEIDPIVTHVNQPMRPKSSLDINMHSKESMYDKFYKETVRPKISQSNTINDNYFYSQERYAEKMRKSAQYLQKMPLQYSPNEPSSQKVKDSRTLDSPICYTNNSSYGSSSYQQPVRSRSALGNGSFLCSQDLENESVTRYQPDQNLPYDLRSAKQDQFTRSASARFAEVLHSDNGNTVIRQDGERKREESMRRLLEWKQRMLQSPLNRKAQGYRPHLCMEPIISYTNPYVDEKKSKKITVGNKKPAFTHPVQYNSYSSDDEENGKSSKPSMHHAQAGRTMDTLQGHISESLTLAQVDSATVTLEEPSADSTETNVDQNIEKIDDMTSEIKTSGELVKSILSEFQEPQDQITYEENYMPMSPKKCILRCDETNSDSTMIPENEENHYVEMTQGNLDTNMKLQSGIDSQYEMVYFRQEITEPVYMEVRGLHKNCDLPDILSPSNNSNNKDNKSDSSDADDEASKELDSLDIQNHPRFSLSDNFRPASYYLGVSKSTLQEYQDSSDSELVSPPPIPNPSPHFEDEDSSTKSDKNAQKNEHLRYLKDDCESCSDVNSEHLGRERLVSASSHSQSSFSISRSEIIGNSISELSPNATDRLNVSHRNTPEHEKCFPGKTLFQNSIKGPVSPSLDLLLIRGRPESASSTSASFLVNSNRSTPIINNESQSNHSRSNSQETNIAPYYYSDICENLDLNMPCRLSTLPLNNQRESINGSKRDISRIMNPIKGNEKFMIDKKESQTQKLATEARSVSVEFLNFTDKSENIDKKNIYESDTLKRQKVEENPTNRRTKRGERNVYPSRSSNKFDIKPTPMKKSFSLEGILENVLNENTLAEHETYRQGHEGHEPEASEGSYLWEEDSVWRERLRTASQRHTKSMDDLDCIEVLDSDISPKKIPRAITRYVTYVNDNFPKPEKGNREDSGKSEIKKKGSFLIDRETLRQWDLMSSAPSDDQLSKITLPSISVAQESSSDTVADLGEGSCDLEGTTIAHNKASGSISINTRQATVLQSNTLPSSGSFKKAWASNLENVQNHSMANFNEFNKYGLDDRHDAVRASLNDFTDPGKINLSAGELLGRTHEELVLLLIQLRRQQSQTFQAIESCYNEIDTMQIHMHNMDQIRRIENLQKLERIKQNLMDLENQYEKGKPLVNLVDNMVKLGSLYRVPKENNASSDELSCLIRDRLQFNQYIQERRLLDEEKKEWDRLEPNPFQLQEKVKQLYQLDGLIQEESRNLHNLQKDKEDIERALGGLRNKLLKGYNSPAEMEQARRQQIALENELSRVHFMLAQNSKRLEETVAGNARLEQELLILKQKLQMSRHPRTSPHQFTSTPENILGECQPFLTGPNPAISSDMDRVQKKIDDLQKQREELRLQVRQLTDRSSHSYQMAKHSSVSENNLNLKRKPTSSWRETDLDTMNNIDHGYGDQHSSQKPLYINTNMKYSDDLHNLKSSDSTSEDTTYFSEKPEIKTVRIVKRESERRQRDREKVSTGKCDSLVEDDLYPVPPQNYYYERTFCNSLPERSQVHKQKVSELSPIFKSEAARQIITEMGKKSTEGQRRTVPREKRRHYTAPHDNTTTAILGTLGERRARDDLDIERALRQRIDAPDIVRSTLGNKELKYNEETIDSILSTPNKISIPERYIPEQSPQLSPEEQERRMKKVESIKKMLSDSAIISTGVPSSCQSTDENRSKNANTAEKSSQSAYILEEKKQREHLLQLNQILAKQVMEISKVVAVRNLEKLNLKEQVKSNDEEDFPSPVTPLPLYQQRENYYS